MHIEKKQRSMEEEKAPLTGEMEEEEVREVEIHLFRQGQGPIAVFKSRLGGLDRNQLEVRNILHTYALKSIFAFNHQSGRGVPIRINPKNGRTALSYRHGAVIYIDGEPKESLLKPIARILVGVVLIAIMITLVSIDTQTPQWIDKLKISGVNFPPLIMAFAVIVLTRFRKKTKVFLKKLGL